MTRVMPGPARLIPLAVAALSVALTTSCSSGGPGAPPDPSTVAQVKARLLAPGMAPGFSPGPTDQQTAQRWARARPFAPPRGSAGQVCSQLATPASFVPNAVLTGGQRISAAHPQLFGPFAPSWSEQIDVYPAAEAATMVKALTTLIGQCRHVSFQVSALGSPPASASETAAALSGLGDQALYVAVRLPTPTPRLFQALDWVVIRSGRTLIWIDDRSGSQVVGTGHDQLTLRLARDAWHHFSAG
jgi:hypothetical protein